MGTPTWSYSDQDFLLTFFNQWNIIFLDRANYEFCDLQFIVALSFLFLKFCLILFHVAFNPIKVTPKNIIYFNKNKKTQNWNK